MFHMFWTGPFTNKPYGALLSFLFTQNLGLHSTDAESLSPICRPKIWVWISPGPAARPPKPTAERDMWEQLKSSPWASPFLHSRFRDTINFKLWNTTEQLDSIPEVRDEWRNLFTLFNSMGHKFKVKNSNVDHALVSKDDASSSEEQKMLGLVGSQSPGSYDQLSTVLSDLARVILCHNFGGIYIDADTIFLRDWEELWGWKGAFAYKWSKHPGYNTAVFHLNKQSALGSFLFRTALRHGLDFHPWSIWNYVKDAHLEGLLLRLPDALFDPAWLNTELLQLERPPQPYFTSSVSLFVSSTRPTDLE